MKFLHKIIGDSNAREIKKYEPIINKINSLEEQFEKLSDKDFPKKTAEFKKRIQDFIANDHDLDDLNELQPEERKEKLKKAELNALDEILPEAFALVREATRRAIGQRAFDVQLIGSIVLHQGKIAEMKTGEGKTLTAAFPLYLNSLSSRGSHLVTVNDYLSKVGAGWMGKIYHLLGVSTAVIGHEFSYIYDPSIANDEVDERMRHFRPVTRQEAYAADILYGTNNEFGFDYLRDNMVQSPDQMVQRELHYAIVDEVDSILIDEARTPLIISAPAEESASLYSQFSELVARLKKDVDFEVDEKMHAATLTDEGIEKVEKILGFPIYEPNNAHLVHYLEEALKAKALFKKDKDYVVKDGEVIIVDEFTGRLMPGRRYSEGLHQAIEAKEKVEVKRESDTLATISFQNFFRMYEKLAGMTGTAATEAEEFYKIYKLEVVIIPPNKTVQRQDLQDQIYKSEDAKFAAVVKDVKARSEAGQPILIGTISIAKSEKLSRALKRDGVKHNVLNAKHHEKEAKIIAEAGRLGAVTVATNMAGRGVDIILGGTMPEDKDSEKLKIWLQEHEKVKSLGGLSVIGTERHESRRIDNQLRGRSGRQGDPGSSQFYVSLEDDLMRIFGGDRIKGIMERLGLPDDMPIEHSMISRSLEQAQRKVEGHNFDIRKHLVEYDDVMNKHRELLYEKRLRILQTGISDDIDEDWLHDYILEKLGPDTPELKSYEEKTNRYKIEIMHQVERAVYLRTIDSLWIEHLNAMDNLREGINLRGYGQRDPLIEYKHEAYNLFRKLNEYIDDEAIDLLLKVELEQGPHAAAPQPKRQMMMQGADESMSGGAVQTQNTDDPAKPMSQKTQSVKQNSSEPHKIGRNDPCPCGSGKKYKKCHGK